MAYSQRRAAPLRVSPMLSADNVSWALRSGPRPTPEYVKAVIRSYVEIKVARGKQKWEIEPKLNLLEREFPQYPDEFQAVRAEFSLPPSRFFPSTQLDMLRRTQTSTATRPTQNVTRTNTTAPRINRVTSAAASVPTRRPTTTTRPDVGDDEEPPPPPYARMDPEPDQTRILEARLAAEAESTGATTYEPPSTAPPSSSSRTSQPASSSNQPQTVYPTESSSRQENETPQRIPSDPELRRIWEDSQFEEAKRLSIAAAREQKDLEEAMALSLAEAEGSRAGPSNRLEVSEDYGERRASSYNSASTSVENRPRIGNGIGQSGAGGVSGISADLAGLDMSRDYDYQQHEENMRQERIEQGRQHHHDGQNPFQQPQHLQSSQQTTSLLDDNDDLPLAVPLTPMKTGAVLQSKNPFLSAADPETEPLPQQTPSAPGTIGTPVSKNQYTLETFHTPVQQHLSPAHSPSSATRRVSSQSLRDSPGSGFTSFHLNDGAEASPRAPKPLPSPPGPGGIQPGSLGSPRASQFPAPQQLTTLSGQQTESYAPPPGPPPPHLRIPTPPAVQQRPSDRENGATPLNQYDTRAEMQMPDDQITSPSLYPSRTNTSNQPPLPPRREVVQSSRQGTIPGFFESTPGQQLTSPTSIHPAPSFSQSGPPRLPLRPTLQNGEDPLELLKSYDTVFLIDDSASMAGERWGQAKAAITEVAEIAAEYDEDGIDVYFLNSKRVGKELKTNEDVEDLFAGLVPRGPTPTGARMEVILRDYMGRLERFNIPPSVSKQAGGSGEQVKPINLIIVTDGAPSDDPGSVIVATAKRLDRGDYPVSQIGIQFFQIGNDPEAREALQELDDGLAETHGIRDMVDTVPYNGEGLSATLILKTLLGGINRRLDRR